MDLSIIFVSYNTAEMSKQAIQLVLDSDDQLQKEIFVVDNASKDSSAEIIQKAFPTITIIKNEKNVGFGRANNQVIPQLSGKYVLLLNTDAFVRSSTLKNTVDFMEKNPSTGILGVKLVGRDNVLQPSCRYFPTPLNLFLKRTGLDRFFSNVQLVDDMSWDHESIRHCDWVPGCYYLTRKAVIDKVGLFDPIFFLYSEEVDHCFATKKAGWEVTYFPHETVVHIGGESAKTDQAISKSSKQINRLQIESELLYFRKNLGLLQTIVHFSITTGTEFSIGFLKALKSFGTRLPQAEFEYLSLFLKIAFQTKLGAKALS